MCRWNAHFGQPALIDELLYRTQHGLIDQSLHARMAPLFLAHVRATTGTSVQADQLPRTSTGR